MKHYKVKNMTRQAGMTLIELTVVLLVLIGLAGLLIPYVSGFVGKTHDSTGVDNQAEIDSMMQRYATQYMRSPNNMEALINAADATAAAGADCAAATANTVYCKMMYTGYFTPLVIAAPMNMSLSMAGITSLYYNNADTDNATFASTVALPTNLSATSTVAGVAIAPDWLADNPAGTIEDYLADVFGTTPNKFDGNCYEYVAFGIGNGSDLNGTVMSTAPVHFASQGTMGPVNKYNRFLVVYQVDKLATASAAAATGLGATSKGCTAGTEAAKFLGSVMAMGQSAGHLWSLAHTQGHTYENIAAGN